MNKLLIILVVAFCSALCFHPSAKADTIVSAPIFVPIANDNMNCAVANISSSTVSATASIYDDSGKLVAKLTWSIPPRQIKILPLGGGTIFYCKVVTANKSKVRVTVFGVNSTDDRPYSAVSAN